FVLRVKPKIHLFFRITRPLHQRIGAPLHNSFLNISIRLLAADIKAGIGRQLMIIAVYFIFIVQVEIKITLILILYIIPFNTLNDISAERSFCVLKIGIAYILVIFFFFKTNITAGG